MTNDRHELTVRQLDKHRNAHYLYLKHKYGAKFARRYFENADRLFPPYSSNIVQYRYAGVVIKESNSYTLHCFSDTDFQKWRVSLKIDVTHQHAEAQPC